MKTYESWKNDQLKNYPNPEVLKMSDLIFDTKASIFAFDSTGTKTYFGSCSINEPNFSKCIESNDFNANCFNFNENNCAMTAILSAIRHNYNFFDLQVKVYRLRDLFHPVGKTGAFFKPSNFSNSVDSLLPIGTLKISFQTPKRVENLTMKEIWENGDSIYSSIPIHTGYITFIRNNIFLEEVLCHKYRTLKYLHSKKP